MSTLQSGGSVRPSPAGSQSASQASGSNAGPQTVGATLHSSPALKQAIGGVVEQVRQASARITDVRPPIDELRTPYQAMLDAAKDTKGRPLLYPYLGSGVGNGALVELGDGSVKWDMICGIGVHFFGHSDPDMVETAVRAGIEDTVQHGHLQSGNAQYRFAQTLLTEARKNSRLNVAFASTSGAMANENGIKACYQKHAPASRVLAFRDCFMGRSVTMCQIGDAAAYRQGVPLSTLVDYMPFYDEVAAKRMGQTRYIDMCVAHLDQYITRYPNQHACFIFELIQGEGGFNTAPRDFFRVLMERCKAAKIAVWDDEIQTFGRTERMFAYETLDLGQYVDVLCVGKMTQACVTLFTDEYNPKPGLLSGTFASPTVCFDVGTRVVERLREGAYYSKDGQPGLIARHHAAFREQVKALAAKHPAWFPKAPEAMLTPGAADIAGGHGGMMRFTPFGGAKDKVTKACQTCFEEGVVLFYCGHDPYHLRMLPPLGVMRIEDWPRVFACVEKGLARVAG
ncbi:MAG: aminotransferase class III-fold pyridoxal phosphate-dependent enzyme [Phycisphaerales bacterium]